MISLDMNIITEQCSDIKYFDVVMKKDNFVLIFYEQICIHVVM